MTPSSRGCVKTSLKRPSCSLPETRRPDEGIARIDQPLGIVAAVEELAQLSEADRPADQEAQREFASHHCTELQRRLRFAHYRGYRPPEDTHKRQPRTADQR